MNIAAPLSPGCSVVIPVYNSDESLMPLAQRLTAVLEERGLEHEIILVEDGSRDESWKCVEAVAARFPTAASAVCEFDLERWQELALGSGRLLSYATPKDLV